MSRQRIRLHRENLRLREELEQLRARLADAQPAGISPGGSEAPAAAEAPVFPGGEPAADAAVRALGLSPDRPGGRRETDRSALAVFEFFRSRSAEVRSALWQSVCREQQRRLQLRPRDGAGKPERDRARAVQALAAAREALGQIPSMAAHDRLRREQPQLGLPSAAFIARVLGGWAGARDLLGDRPAAHPGADGRRRLGPFFDLEWELAPMLRAASAAAGGRTLSRRQFREWLAIERDGPSGRFARLPHPGSHVFARHGGFEACCQAAGVLSAGQAMRQCGRPQLTAMLQAAAGQRGITVQRPGGRPGADPELDGLSGLGARRAQPPRRPV